MMIEEGFRGGPRFLILEIGKSQRRAPPRDHPLTAPQPTARHKSRAREIAPVGARHVDPRYFPRMPCPSWGILARFPSGSVGARIRAQPQHCPPSGSHFGAIGPCYLGRSMLSWDYYIHGFFSNRLSCGILRGL